MPEKKTKASFAELLEAEARKVNLAPKAVSFPSGHVIFEEGDVGDGVYFFDEGLVEIVGAMPEGQSRVYSTLGIGSFFGEMAVVDDQPRSATARTITAVRARFFSREEVWNLVAKSPPLLIALMREVSNRMRQAERRCMEDVFQAERLALVGRFAQSIVHDLKNPLNTIGIGVDLASSEDSTPEVRREAGLLVRKQVDRLAGMIHEVLEFTRGTTRSLDLVPTDFREFIKAAIAEIRPGAETRGVKVECESEPPALTVLIDQVRLMHVINNLANNAVDAMASGGKIVLQFRKEDRHVFTEIKDTGPGIAPEIASRLFEPFVTHGKSHGTGLGLSICKRIIEAHNGTITVNSEPGRGAVFSFSLRQEP